MEFTDLLPLILGSGGALVLSAAAAFFLARQHRADDKAKDDAHARELAHRDKEIDHERTRTAAAESRLDSLGGTLNAATKVMDRAVAITEKAIDRLTEAGQRERTR